MWEFECHDWKALRGFEAPRDDVPVLLERLFGSSNEEEWQVALDLLESYASDLGLPSEALKDVVACLVAVATRTEGRKRSVLLGALAELTCGRGIEEYRPEQHTWLRAAVRELAYALHTWAQLAESAPAKDATHCIEILVYCAAYVPDLELKILRYIQLCATQRPELGEEISGLLATFNDIKRLLSERDSSAPTSGETALPSK